MADPIPDLLVELLRLGELPEAEARELRRRLEAEGDPRLEQLARSDHDVLERYPPSMMVPRLRAALDPPPRRRWRIPAAALATAAAVALVWALDPAPAPSPPVDAGPSAETSPPAGPETTRDKGGERLLVHRKLPAGSEPLDHGDRVRAGDVLQLGYVPGTRAHGVIVSIDGAQGVTLHWPPTAEDPTDLAEGPTQLEYAFELDGSPAFERFVFVTADEPIDVSAVLRAARTVASDDDVRDDALPLPDPWGQLDLLLIKD